MPETNNQKATDTHTSLAVREASGNATPTVIGLSHNHFCEHCDRTWSHPVCSLAYDVSKYHLCEERQRYVKAMTRAMQSNDAGCRYGCTRLPCAHGFALRYPGKTINPKPSKLVTVGTIEFAEDIPVSKYSTDGILTDNDVIRTRNAWIKARENKLRDSAKDTPWLAELLVESRKK